MHVGRVSQLRIAVDVVVNLYANRGGSNVERKHREVAGDAVVGTWSAAGRVQQSAV